MPAEVSTANPALPTLHCQPWIANPGLSTLDCRPCMSDSGPAAYRLRMRTPARARLETYWSKRSSESRCIWIVMLAQSPGPLG